MNNWLVMFDSGLFSFNVNAKDEKSQQSMTVNYNEPK